MNSKIDVTSLVLGAIAGMALILSVGAAAPSSADKGWEYRIVSGKPFGGELEKGINAGVTEGWEFVTVSDMSTEQYAFAVLKRQKRR